MKRLGILIILLLLIVGGTAAMLLKDDKYPDSGLKEVRYYHGGSMLGERYTATLTYVNEKEARLVMESMPSHSERVTISEYTVDISHLHKIEELMKEYDQLQASKRPYSEYQALDGPSSSITFDFFDRSFFRVEDQKDMSDKESEGMKVIRDYLYALAEGKEGITIVKERQMNFSLHNGYTLSLVVDNSVSEQDFYKLCGEHEFVRYEDNGFSYQFDEALNYSDYPGVEKGYKGQLVYDCENNTAILFYGDFEPREEYRKLGELDESSIELCDVIADIKEGTYTFYATNN
jgi:hypothetical protein